MQEQIAQDLCGKSITDKCGNIDPKRSSTGSKLLPSKKARSRRVGRELVINQGIERVENKRYVLHPLEPAWNSVGLNEKPASAFQKRDGKGIC